MNISFIKMDGIGILRNKLQLFTAGGGAYAIDVITMG